MAKHRIIGIDFSHMHMGDLLGQVCAHPDAEVVGVWHSDIGDASETLRMLDLPLSLFHSDWRRCIEDTQPTAVVLCAPTDTHRMWAERIAAYDLDMLVEKPFAKSTEDADAMIAAFNRAGRKLAINWPLAWYPVHRTTKRLIDEGVIGRIKNIHYYDGNRGPLRHTMKKIELKGKQSVIDKRQSWFYSRDRGGGSLQDYLGYGTTLATWFNSGATPYEVTSIVDEPPRIEVDEHSITVARYATGLYKFETRWGTFTDPWTHQPAPKCGFVICGSAGTITSYDFESTVRVQTKDRPDGFEIAVDIPKWPNSDPISYFLDCVDQGCPITGPLSPETSRIGQQIVDAAVESIETKASIRFESAVGVPRPHLQLNPELANSQNSDSKPNFS